MKSKEQEQELTQKELIEVTGGSNPIVDALVDAVVDAVKDFFTYKGPQAS